VKSSKKIRSVEIDPKRLLPDVDGTNNSWLSK
jgi:hypothetical protein